MDYAGAALNIESAGIKTNAVVEPATSVLLSCLSILTPCLENGPSGILPLDGMVPWVRLGNAQSHEPNLLFGEHRLKLKRSTKNNTTSEC